MRIENIVGWVVVAVLFIGCVAAGFLITDVAIRNWAVAILGLALVGVVLDGATECAYERS